MNKRENFFSSVRQQCEAIPHYPHEQVTRMLGRLHPLDKDIIAFLFYLPAAVREQEGTERAARIAASLSLTLIAFNTHSFVKETESHGEKMHLLVGDFLLTLAYGYLKENCPPAVLGDCALISEAISQSWFCWAELTATERSQPEKALPVLAMNYGRLFTTAMSLACEEAGCEEAETSSLIRMASLLAIVWGAAKRACGFDLSLYQDELSALAAQYGLTAELDWFRDELYGHVFPEHTLPI